ncbi:MAG TPA: sigma-54 dependent transcriptional regulator [Pirellulaceae bacterium]|nr:sigma-54 dependent transcriptional regulator [Pirellulaceae bacterium]HMO93754.1 sigma-54 dependent transcriptional regulator [Pirellulaceae bacterium]HMP69909.1 sigma-54 dependent transcriptional regulator [Pirellulaceae bacterium]
MRDPDSNPNSIIDSFNPASVRILLVDNDRDLAEGMAETLARIGLKVTIAASGPQGAAEIKNGIFDLIITDLVMNEVDGMKILKLAKEMLPDALVIMVTGHATVSLAVQAMETGAYTFVEKPVTQKRLQTVVTRAIEAIELKNQNIELHRRLDEKFGFENFVYASESMRGLIDRLKRIAPTDVGVLITGETGTGKDVVAQAIHQNSPRKHKPFVAINTGAVAEHLVESELFGHVKGAFTDAIGDREGKFQYADGGTLFLDEVGDMPMPTQIKFLRVLEERKITRVGENKPIPVNVRVIAATNQNLEKDVQDGKFRKDLYYRLNVVTIHLDPLRERREDIIPLADHFRKMANKQNGKAVKSFTPKLRKWMHEFEWSGNVRQLKHVVESMVVLDIDDVLDLDDLSPELYEHANHDLVADGKTATDTDATWNRGTQSGLADSQLVGKSLKEIERWAIEQSLVLAGGNREETAKILGISARNLYRKLKEYEFN